MEFNPAMCNFEKMTAPRAPSAPSPAGRREGMKPGLVEGVPASPHLAQGQEMVCMSTDEGNRLIAPEIRTKRKEISYLVKYLQEKQRD